jgi:nicotinate phosphoribosyltransferase
MPSRGLAGENSPLLTDLYQLAMMDAYHQKSMEAEAVFEFFVRKLPPGRGFLVAAGLEQALAYLEGVRFAAEEIEWLSSTGAFSAGFIERLASLRFTGSVHAMPEGTLAFPNEPLFRVTAPIAEAQLVETRLINILQFQTMIASKAARCVLASGGKPVIDFGLRRAHGAEAGMLASRACYLAGFAATSNLLASKEFGIPAVGTMAHSFVLAHEEEEDAFERFAGARPRDLVLLIDTYDTEEGARKVVKLKERLAQKGIDVKGVRLDSGDLADHARKVRAILDEGGLGDARIVVSGGLDEDDILRLRTSGAPIDAFAVGTKVVTSADAPYLDCAYKLVEYEGRPVRKRSEGKATLPGRKQVFRARDERDGSAGDTLGLEDDGIDGEPLIAEMMRGGRRLASPEPMASIRKRAAAGLGSLPGHLRALAASPAYRVTESAALRALAARLDGSGT